MVVTVLVLGEHAIYLAVLESFNGISEENGRKLLILDLFHMLTFDEMGRLL
jgi:hypothetical protein